MISKFIFLSILSFVFVVFDLYFHKRLLGFFVLSAKIKKLFTGVLIVWQLGFVALSFSAVYWSVRPFFAAVLGFMLFCVVFGGMLEVAWRFRAFERVKRLLLGVFATLFSYSFYVASLPPNIKEINIKASHASMQGLKLAVIADAHIDPSKQEFSQEIVGMINAVKPDATLIVGDLCDGRIEDVKEALMPFSRLNSKYGVFFSPGNHEYYYADFESKMAFLRGLGVKTLINKSEKIGDISIVGLSDPAAKKAKMEEPNPSAAYKGVKSPSILMAHQPISAKEALGFKPDFVFCGHTHNGQIWPFKYLVSLVQPYTYGEYKDGASKIFVTSGVGLWGPPMRLFSRSEILVVTFF